MSEDRREQLRALRLLGVIVLIIVISGAGLWIFIRDLANAPVEHTASPSTVDTRRGTTAGAPASPLPKEPERGAEQGLSPEVAVPTSGESKPLSTLTEAEPAQGYPVSEDTFVQAYVLANKGRDDGLDDEQLAQLGHDAYQMARSINTDVLLFLGTGREKRTIDFLDKVRKLRDK